MGRPSLKAERMWEQVNKTPTCWTWQGALTSSGYGALSVKAKMQSAHRLAWFLAHGPIPPDMFVLHKCDHPSCVNPDHLFLGTQADNVQDARKKGKYANPKNRVRGDGHGKVKLTIAAVEEIRREYQQHSRVKYGVRTKLAKKFGVHPAVIGAGCPSKRLKVVV